MELQTGKRRWQETHSEMKVQNGDPDHFLDNFATPYLEALLHNLMERFPEQSLAVLNAAEVFDPTKCPLAREDRYHYGRDEIVILAEHYDIETTITLSEWKEVVCTLMNFSHTQISYYHWLNRNRCTQLSEKLHVGFW